MWLELPGTGTPPRFRGQEPTKTGEPRFGASGSERQRRGVVTPADVGRREQGAGDARGGGEVNWNAD
jgi:hypothetical protein